MQRDEVAIMVMLHELDFVALLRASRLVGMSREELVKRVIVSHLVALQKQGIDLGIKFPEEPARETKESEPVGGKDGEKA